MGALNACKQGMSNRGFTRMVINMSLGGSVPSKTEEQAFNQAYGQNVLSVAAAGNAGNTSKSYPASYGSVVSVAAIDANKQLAYFSQRNDQVELAAPGVSVLSTVPTGYAYYSGTSMATPHVTGVAWSGRSGWGAATISCARPCAAVPRTWVRSGATTAMATAWCRRRPQQTASNWTVARGRGAQAAASRVGASS